MVVGGFASGNVSGGSLNPAVSVALALSGGGLGNALGNSEASGSCYPVTLKTIGFTSLPFLFKVFSFT